MKNRKQQNARPGLTITQAQLDSFVDFAKACERVNVFINDVATTLERLAANQAAMASELVQLKLDIAALKFGRDRNELEGE